MAPAIAPAQTDSLLGIGAPAPQSAQSAPPAPTGVSSAASAAPAQAPQVIDYSANAASDVFGANLFTGAFSRQSATQFNPDYAVAVGDSIQLRLWGGYNFDSALTVDPQGNIFVPNIGPVRVLGVRNQALQEVVESAVRKVFRANVASYASLASAQPVRVFVGGFVKRPGLYGGTSMDSLLFYLDQAGGIDPERGTFLDIEVKRGGSTRARVDLYDFLLHGRIQVLQLADGDVIFVGARQSTVSVVGLAENARRFEFRGADISAADLVRVGKPRGAVTHARITRNTGTLTQSEYHAIGDLGAVRLRNGDVMEFTADKKPGTITVRVQGEHLSDAQEYVLPYGARYRDVMRNIRFSERSDKESVQLFRQSVRERQKQMLNTALQSLAASVLTARSGTGEEAQLRTAEANLILRWVDRAKDTQPSGQVLLAGANGRDDLLLENGDVINVPSLDGLVLVSGEVLFPNAIAFEQNTKVDDLIRRAGGYTQNADNSRIVVAHRDGSFDLGEDAAVHAGDQVLILPKVDVKSRAFWKDIVQIMFQIAVTTKVVLGL